MGSCVKSYKWDIRGNWYTFSKSMGGGLYDSTLSYAEFYINDSIREVQEETFGQHQPQKYFIKGDSIFIRVRTLKDTKFIPMYKISKLERDTLWLTINPNWAKEETTYWVKFPKNEKGQFDHEYTAENSDSLKWAVVFDWQRRRDKHFSILGGNQHIYDSLLKAGKYRWSMKDISQE